MLVANCKSLTDSSCTSIITSNTLYTTRPTASLVCYFISHVTQAQLFYHHLQLETWVVEQIIFFYFCGEVYTVGNTRISLKKTSNNKFNRPANYDQKKRKMFKLKTNRKGSLFPHNFFNNTAHREHFRFWIRKLRNFSKFVTKTVKKML